MNLCMITGGILYGAIEISYLNEKYRASVDKAFEEMVEEGLCSWEYKGELKEGDYCDIVWAVRAK